jgi:hypothetical protein
LIAVFVAGSAGIEILLASLDRKASSVATVPEDGNPAAPAHLEPP